MNLQETENLVDIFVWQLPCKGLSFRAIVTISLMQNPVFLKNKGTVQ